MTKKKKLIVLIVATILVVISTVAYIIYANYETKSKMIEHQDYTKINKDYWKSVDNIIKDEYVTKIASYIMVKNITTPNIITSFVVPNKIDGKVVETIKPENFFSEYLKIYDSAFLGIEENDEIKLSIYGDKSIKIKEIRNTKKGKITYKEKDNEFTFKSVGEGKYIVELLINKDDIFYLVF